MRKTLLTGALTALAVIAAVPADAGERKPIDVRDLLGDIPPPPDENTLSEGDRFQKWWWYKATPQDRVSICTANAHRLFLKTLRSSDPKDWEAAQKYDRKYGSGKIHLRKANPTWQLREVFALIEAQEEKIKTFSQPTRMEVNYLCEHGGRIDQ